jgi:hypothetical protein
MANQLSIADQARRETSLLREGLVWRAADESDWGEFWDFANHEAESRQRARAIRALEMLRQYAGRDSAFATQAEHQLLNNAKSYATGIPRNSEVRRSP